MSKFALLICTLLAIYAFDNHKTAYAARIVKTKYGDDYRKWDLKELFGFGPYDKTKIVQSIRQKYRIPWNQPLSLKYRDIDGDWITFETEEEICPLGANLFLEVFTSSSTSTTTTAQPAK